MLRTMQSRSTSPSHDDYDYAVIFQILLTDYFMLQQQRQMMFNIQLIEFLSIVLIAHIIETERQLYNYNFALQQQYIQTPRFNNNRHAFYAEPQQANAPFRSAREVPKNFKVAPAVLEDLKQGKIYDVSEFEPKDMEAGKTFACVKLPDNTFQIYKVEDLKRHLEVNQNGNVFKDILTGQKCKFNEVFTLTTEQLKQFADPRQENSVNRRAR